MNTGSALTKLQEILPEQEKRMPALFIGHGSPMNGIETNAFSEAWVRLGKELPQPVVILVVSAHWYTAGTFITAMEKPRTIHDFGGFPRALYEVQYPAPGSPVLAKELKSMLQGVQVELDQQWGLDHGTWTVLRRMFPQADIPVLQLSIDFRENAQFHYNLGAQLAPLRKKGVLIVSSGNIIHNLSRIDFAHLDTPDYGYDWAREIHALFNEKILTGDHKALINYQNLGKAAMLAVPTPDHYLPLLYTLGMQEKGEHAVLFNNSLVGGSLNMTSVKIQ